MSGKSRIEKILENLLGENNVIEPPIGRDEKILYSILNDLEYTEPPHSIFEELLLAIKNSSPLETEYAYEYLTRDEKILFCKLNRLEYFEPPHSRLEKLLIKWLYLDLYLNIDGIPPFTFISNGSPIIDYTIYSNTIRNYAPAPASPVMPQGTGERTGNLWSNRGFSATTITLNNTHNISNNYGTTLSTTEGDEVTITQSEYPTGNVGYQNGFFMIDVDFSKYAVGDVVTISFDYIVNEVHASSTQKATIVYAGKNNNAVPTTLSSGDWNISGRLTAVITIIANMDPYVEVRLLGNSITVKNIMLNEGSIALPYEPYGYKLDISCGDTVTPIYLGEVASTRKIKKLVLTGEENFVYDSNYTRFRFVMPNSLIIGVRRTPVICTHYEALTDGRPIEEVINNTIYSDSARQDRWWIEDKRFSSANDFKAYLAEQYAAGTPVTIWYILTEPETAIVNEPLMKIGDYADSISYEQTVVSIPTVNGRNTFDVLGDVKPSNVELTYAPRAPLLRTRKTILKK